MFDGSIMDIDKLYIRGKDKIEKRFGSWLPRHKRVKKCQVRVSGSNVMVVVSARAYDRPSNVACQITDIREHVM